MTSVRVDEEEYVLNSFDINLDNGILTLPSTSQQYIPTDKNPKSGGNFYAAPLCASRDGLHLYVTYPGHEVYAFAIGFLRG